jgi:hypothetical protein
MASGSSTNDLINKVVGCSADFEKMADLAHLCKVCINNLIRSHTNFIPYSESDRSSGIS